MIPTQTVIEKFDSLPPKLRETATSISTGQLIWAICKSHNIDDVKIGDVIRLVATVLFGFIHPEELRLKIQEETGLNPKTAEALANEIDLKIFSGLYRELREAYKPLAPQETEETAPSAVSEKPQAKTISLEVIGGKIENGEKQIPIEKTKTEESEKIKPLILHEERPLAEEKERPKARGFSLPFKFWKKEKKSSDTTSLDSTRGGPVKAIVEAPERIVHYSELSTPIPAIGGENIINLETMGAAMAESNFDAKAPATPENPILKEIAKEAELARQDPLEADRSKTVATAPLAARPLAEQESKKPFWSILNRVKEHSDSSARLATDPTQNKPEPAEKTENTQEKKEKGPELKGNIVDLTQKSKG